MTLPGILFLIPLCLGQPHLWLALCKHTPIPPPAVWVLQTGASHFFFGPETKVGPTAGPHSLTAPSRHSNVGAQGTLPSSGGTVTRSRDPVPQTRVGPATGGLQTSQSARERCRAVGPKRGFASVVAHGRRAGWAPHDRAGSTAVDGPHQAGRQLTAAHCPSPTRSCPRQPHRGARERAC